MEFKRGYEVRERYGFSVGKTYNVAILTLYLHSSPFLTQFNYQRPV